MATYFKDYEHKKDHKAEQQTITPKIYGTFLCI